MRGILHTHNKTKHANHGNVHHCLFCRPWLSATHSGTALWLPMSLAQGPLPGFVCAVADSRVWGTKMAPTKKLGDGRSTGLRQSPLVGLHNNQQNDGVGGRGGIGEETRQWRTSPWLACFVFVVCVCNTTYTKVLGYVKFLLSIWLNFLLDNAR